MTRLFTESLIIHFDWKKYIFTEYKFTKNNGFIKCLVKVYNIL